MHLLCGGNFLPAIPVLQVTEGPGTKSRVCKFPMELISIGPSLMEKGTWFPGQLQPLSSLLQRQFLFKSGLQRNMSL